MRAPMRRPKFTLLLGLALLGSCLAGLVVAQQSKPASEQETDPLDIGKQEKVDVRLVQIDVVVLDRQDRTVPDLTIDDFEILVDGKRRAIDTMDLACDEGALDDVQAVSHPKKRKQLEAGSGQQIVLAVDYLHLTHQQRAAVLDEARLMVRHASSAGDSIMVAALNGGLRIEQAFTTDHDSVIKTLQRMEYDLSLSQPSYWHQSELPFFQGATALFSVLETVPGHKAIVLFSNNRNGGIRDDLQFARLAASAAASRRSVYPAYAPGLEPPES